MKKIFESSVVRNFSILTISNIVVQALSIFSSIRIAKNLKPDLFGNYSYILSLSSIYLVISGLGLRNVIIRNVAVRRLSNSIFWDSSVSRSFMFFVSCLIILIYNFFFSSMTFDIGVVILLLIYILASLHWDTLESVNFGFEKMEYSALINVSFTFVFVVSINVLPISSITVFNILFINVVVQILKVAVYGYISYSNGLFAKVPNLIFSRLFAQIKEAMPYYILAIFTLFTSQIPILYLEHLSTPQEIGYFNISNRIISPLQMLLLTLLSSLFPNLSRTFEFDRDRFNKTVRLAFIVIFSAGVFGALVVSSFRAEVINLLYGPEYKTAAEVIAIQCWFTVLFGVFCLIGTVLGAVSKQKLIAKLSFVYAIVSFPCLYFGARFGAEGLSIGFVIMALLNMTYHIFWMQKAVGKILPSKYILVGALVYSSLFILSFQASTFSLSNRISAFVVLIALTLVSFWRKIRLVRI